jgi:hypothetical protein
VLWEQKDGASSPFIGSDREEKARQGGGGVVAGEVEINSDSFLFH